jgi:hypothetical protein
MADSPRNWLWLVRLHPRMMDRAGEIRRLLEGRCAYELDLSTQLSLYAVMRLSHLTLTCWSTTCHESVALGRPAAIIHPAGQEIFAEDIAAGQVHYAPDEGSLRRLLSRADLSGTEVGGEPFIETDPALAVQALAEILIPSCVQI